MAIRSLLPPPRRTGNAEFDLENIYEWLADLRNSLVSTAEAEAAEEASRLRFHEVSITENDDSYWFHFPTFLQQTVQITAASLVSIDATCLFMHKGVLDGGGATDYPIGVAFALGMRGPYSAEAEVPLWGARAGSFTDAERQANLPTFIHPAGQNIASLFDHYYNAVIPMRKVIETAGWYSFEVWWFAVTTSFAVGTGGLVELTAISTHPDAPPFTRMFVRIEPAPSA